MEARDLNSGKIADRELLRELFPSLHENRIIYHERITVISEVIKVEISDEEFELWHKPFRLLSAEPVFNGMYEGWQEEPYCAAGVPLNVENHPYIYDRGRLSMPYSGFLIWPSPEIVSKLSECSDDDVHSLVGRILWNRESTAKSP